MASVSSYRFSSHQGDGAMLQCPRDGEDGSLNEPLLLLPGVAVLTAPRRDSSTPSSLFGTLYLYAPTSNLLSLFSNYLCI